MVHGVSISSLITLAAHYGIEYAGFTSSGIAANSLAATVQSLIGKVSKNSIFALFQSLGARGVLLRASSILGVGGMITGVIAYYIWGWFTSYKLFKIILLILEFFAL